MKHGMSVFFGSVAMGLFAIGCQSNSPVSPALSATQSATGPASPRPSVSVAEVTNTLKTLRSSLDARMVIQITDAATGRVLQCPPEMKLPGETDAISPAGYPAGVIYAGMLNAADATGDREFSDFVARRFQFFADTIPISKGSADGKGLYHNWLTPISLDSCGAMGAAFVKARRQHIGGDLKAEIDRFDAFVASKQFRLPDGTLARHRPYPESLWADDMYMSIPFLAQMGALTNNSSYYDDAAKQVIQISARLFVPSSNLYTHGWNAGTGNDQPHYYWGRANGWCAMAMVELLDVLPVDHPQRAEILRQLREEAKGVASVQGGNGLWHQMLDRPDSCPETSCSAMFTFAIARAVNNGWLDSGAYGPVAIAGWNGIASRIDSTGHVTGTCVSTSYAADYPYYYNRRFTDDQHGYGPVLLAGSEIIKLMNNPRFRVRDEAGKLVLFTR